MRAARETLEVATLTAKVHRTSATCSIMCAFGFGIATAITALLAYGLNVWHFGQTGTHGWYYGTYEVCATVTNTDLNTFDILSGDWSCKSWDDTSLTSMKGFDGCKTAAEIGDVFVILGAAMAAAVAVSCLVHFCYSLESKRCLNLAMTSSSIGALILVIVCFITAPANMAVECADFNNSLSEAAGSEDARGISFYLMIVAILFAAIALIFYCRVLRRISKQEHNARFENDLTRFHFSTYLAPLTFLTVCLLPLTAHLSYCFPLTTNAHLSYCSPLASHGSPLTWLLVCHLLYCSPLTAHRSLSPYLSPPIHHRWHCFPHSSSVFRRTSIVIIPDQLSPPQKAEQLPTVAATDTEAKKIEKKDTCALRVRLHQVYTVETIKSETTILSTTPTVSDSSLVVERSQSLAQLGSSIGAQNALPNNTKPGQMMIQIPDDDQGFEVDDPEYGRQRSMEIAAQL